MFSWTFLSLCFGYTRLGYPWTPKSRCDVCLWGCQIQNTYIWKWYSYRTLIVTWNHTITEINTCWKKDLLSCKALKPAHLSSKFYCVWSFKLFTIYRYTIYVHPCDRIHVGPKLLATSSLTKQKLQRLRNSFISIDLQPMYRLQIIIY